MTELPTLLDRYCTCKTLCVWIPIDPPNFVWSVPPRAFQAYCPTCKIIVNEYYEKNEHNALMLTPKVSFAIFKENENLNAEIARLRAALKAMESCDNCKYSGYNVTEYPCSTCDECTDKWEAK